MHSGWYQVAYSRDVLEPLNEVWIGEEPIALVRFENRPLVAISAWCPHRGANLCHGGQVSGDAVICPFHGFHVNLENQGRFQAERLDVMEIGGLVFVKKPGGRDCGLMHALKQIGKHQQFVPGFELALRAPAELVVENAFDQSHFRPVHHVENAPQFHAEPHPDGAYSVGSTFALPTSQWQKGPPGSIVDVPFVATAFSPTVVLSTLGGDNPYSMLTATVPISPTEASVRLSLVVPGTPGTDACLYLLEQAKSGLFQDAAIWGGMRHPARIDPVESDAFVLGFRAFCHGFHHGARTTARSAPEPVN